MKTSDESFYEILGPLPAEKVLAADYQFDVADRIYALMKEQGLNQKQLAIAIGHRPSEISKWLSGQHNFTLKTLALLTNFFGKPLITVVK
ncbi:MAG: helix-turn-helix transcriptional regulator [Muribaculaceae bacterium]|nr:helix-turn-helix transcriptional regulator [Muribaculaceae bacterium]